jgi:hypothetical protein
MTIESKRKPLEDDRNRDERERMWREELERKRLRQEETLDEALKNTPTGIAASSMERAQSRRSRLAAA